MFGPRALPRTFDAALRDLGSAKPDVRRSAAEDLAAAGQSDPSRAADALAPLLRDRDPRVRRAAVVTLGALDARDHVDALAACFDDDDSETRQHAVMSLGEVAGDAARATLRGALSHAQPDVRFQALLALARVAPDEAAPVALKNLRDDDPWIASAGAQVLGTLGEADGALRCTLREPLIAALDTARPRVAVCAALALEALGEPDGFGVLRAFVRREVRVPDDDEVDLLVEAIDRLGEADVARYDEARDALSMHASKLLPSPLKRRAQESLARLDARRGASR